MNLILPSEALNRPFIGLNEISDDTEDELFSFHTFTLGNLGMVIPLEMVSEVIEDVAFCELPNTNMLLYGMANVRGKIIPIFNLHNYLSIESDKDLKILVIGSGEDAGALLIDGYPYQTMINTNNTIEGSEYLPDEIKENLHKAYQVDDKIWFELDVIKLFTSLSQHI